ncbi:MAG TPA: LamG-like jellyroll fold domain-containing protein [Verrucomicrobiae bacterium]
MKTSRFAKPFCRTLSGVLLPALLLAATAPPSRAGVSLRLGYDGITGDRVSDLTSNPAFPSSPTGFDVLTNGLVIPMNIANDYGSFVRGFIEAPQTGTYTFWIAGVDSGEFWLSPSENPAGKILVAQNGFVAARGPNDWFLDPSQRSAPISLVRGQKYYFEMLHKEDAHGTYDSCSAAWTLPDGTFQGPIPSANIWPFPVDLADPSYPPQNKAPQVLDTYNGTVVDALPSIAVAPDGGTADLTVTVEATQPATVQWSSNGVAIPDANLLSYHISKVTSAIDGTVYTVTIQNALGQATASTTLSVQPEPVAPTLVDALSLANTAGDIAVVFSKPVDPVTATATGNYSFSPTVAINGARMGASPNTVLLQTAGLSVGTAYTLAVSNVRDRTSAANVILPGSSVPIEQYLANWYRLDESTGATSGDSSGNSLNGTLVNDVLPGYAGQVLKSVKFQGVTGGHVALPSGFSDFTTNGMTVSLWVYPTSESSTALWARFIDFANGPANNNILFARTADANQVTFEVYQGGTTGGKVTSPLGSLIVNQWQHWAATMDVGGIVVIYRNGVPVVTGNTGVPNVVTRNNNYLGRSNWTGDGYYAGEMDDVRIYNRVLDPAAVAVLANGGGPDDTDASVPVVSATATVPSTALKNTPPGVFTITRSGATTAALTVNYALGGTATNGMAYNTLSGSVVIPAGANSAQVLVTPIDFSFQGPQQTVVLTVTGSTAYAIAVADGGTVTIQNNDVAPSAIAATTDNGLGGAATTVDVWFASGVTAPSATTLANYTLINAPGVSISGASLLNRNLRVVLAVSGTIPAGAQVGVTNVLDAGGNSASAQIPIRLRLAPINLVANVYHSPDNNRPACFTLATDGIVDSFNNAAGFDTWSGGGQPSEFVGLVYDYNQDFEVVRVDLGNQFGDGGSWAVQPKLYILKNPVDSNQTRPETDPTDWAEVPAPLISGSQFHVAIDPNPSPNTPIVFNLSGLSASQRNGYGWAVGGVKGSGSADFISISEVASYGTAGSTLAFAFAGGPSNVTVTAGQRAKFSVVAQSTMPLTYQWLKSGNPIADATATFYGTPPALLTDNGATFAASVGVGGITTTNSPPATLTVLARPTPQIVAATYDPSNLVVEVWFNGSTEPSSTLNSVNYTLNAPSVTIATLAQEAQGCGAALTLSGPVTVANPTVAVSGVMDLDGNTIPAQTVPILPLVSGATNVVANAYQQGRAAALARSTDGVVINDANVTTWTTWDGTSGHSDFVGLGYSEPQVFGMVKVDLGWQFFDGGDWSAQPTIFILKNPIDTNMKWPETDPLDWIAVPASLVSANIFDMTVDQPVDTVPLINSPIVFDLSHLPLAARTGWGWAMGGVPGNGPVAQFVSIAEARAFGVAASTVLVGMGSLPQILLDITPSSVYLPSGSPLTLSVPLVVGSAPLNYQWQQNGINLSDSARVTGSQTATLRFAPTALSDSGDYRLIVANGLGSATSAVAHVTIASPITFNGNGAGWTLSTITTNVPIANNVLTLTDGGLGEARSCFSDYPLFIGKFTASFTYRDIGGGGADGAVFAIQNSPMGHTALGGAGGGLGFAGITPSVGLEMNIYGPNTVGIALRNNGVTGGPYTATPPVNLASGNPINFTINYDGTTASLTMTDTVAATSFSGSFPVDIPSLVGGSTAFVGFTGASGGVASYQQISNFMFANEVTAQPTLSVQRGAGNTVLLTWPASATGFILQQTSDLTSGNWSQTPGTPILVGGQYQLSVTTSGGPLFYRLKL